MCFRLSPVNICSKIKRLKVELRASHHQPFSLTKAVSTISPKVKPLTTRYFLKVHIHWETTSFTRNKRTETRKKNEQQQKQRKSNENVSELCTAKRSDRLKQYLYSYIYLLYIQACMCNLRIRGCYYKLHQNCNCEYCTTHSSIFEISFKLHVNNWKLNR